MTRIARALCALAAATALSTPVWAEAPAAPVPSAQAPAQQQQRPNVLVWMMDDVGFAQLSSFGGLVQTPNIDRVASRGLRYSNYHTAPVCSAARAAFLTGRMPHNVGIGGHAAVARPFPGYSGRIPRSAGTIAENFRLGGYTTLALGKWDHLLAEETTPAGPYTQWPAGQGFERFYGFLSADIDNWHPTLVRDTTPVATPDAPGYHLNHDLADQAIAMIGARRAAPQVRPFFLYWATGTSHAPHHAPAEWIARYKGKFDQGWDKAREDILKAQKRAGVVPRNATLAPRPEGVPAWSELSPAERALFARQMEVFAGSLTYADAQFGRILDSLEAAGELDNTIVVVTSDNGASAEGSRYGMYSEALLGRGRSASLEENLAFAERWGGPESYPHYAMGWAVAGNTPFRYYKQTTYEGGSRVPLVIAWPKGIAAHGELRSQFVHVADLAPTLLDLSGTPLAARVNNADQQPMDGASFTASLADAKAPAARTAQYFEMFGNKGLWQDGWTIVTRHRVKPWEMTTSHPVDEKWELYDLSTDIAQAKDLAAAQPQRVAAMAAEFERQAERYHVNPIGNIVEGMVETQRKAQADFAARGGVWRYPGPVSNIQQTIGPPIAALGFTQAATLDLPAGAAVTGPVFAVGGTLGGMALYLRAGKPVFAVNTLDGRTHEIAASEALPAGTTRLELRFERPRGPGAASATITAGGRVLASGAVPADVMSGFGVFELLGVGIDHATPVLRGAQPGGTLAAGISDVVFDFSGGR